ncbi:hypothetical protein [Nonomuraea sp. NPDC002799]
MIYTLQLTATHFLDLIRDQLRSRSFCFTQEIPLSGATVLLDHVEVTDRTTVTRVAQASTVVGGDSARHPVDGSALRVSQQLVLHFVTISDLQAGATAPTSSQPGFAPSITVHFVVSMTTQAGRPAMHVAYQPPADPGGFAGLTPHAAQLIDGELSGVTGSVALPLNGFQALIMEAPSFVNAGIVLDDSGRTITVQMEDHPQDRSVAAWQDFYAGRTPDLRDGRPWAALIDRTRLQSIALTYFEAALDEAARLGKRPSGQAVSRWAGNGHSVQVSQSGRIRDAGPLGSDLAVTISLDLDFSLPQADVLLLTLSLSGSAQATGIVGDLLDLLGIGIDPDSTLPAAGGWDQVGPRSYARKEYLRLANPAVGHLVVEEIVPDSRGLLLRGSVQRMGAVVPARVEAEVEPFTWGLHGSCSEGLDVACGGLLYLTNGGTAPLNVCEARVLFDPDEQFPLVVEQETSPSAPFDISVRVSFRALKPAYLARPQPYPCLLLVKTNGGARAVSFGVPPLLDDADRRGMEMERIAIIGNCDQLVDRFFGKGLNPKWLPNPPPDGRELHLWEVLVHGLEPDEQATVLDARGRLVAAGQAGAGGIAFARAVIEPAADGREVTLNLTTPPGLLRRHTGVLTVARQPRSVEVRQTQLRPAATIHLGERAVSLLPGVHEDRPVLTVISGFLAQLYDLDVPARPVLLRELPATELGNAGVDLTSGSAARSAPATRGAGYMRAAGIMIGYTYARVEPDGITVTIYAPGSSGVVTEVKDCT